MVGMLPEIVFHLVDGHGQHIGMGQTALMVRTLLPFPINQGEILGMLVKINRRLAVAVDEGVA